MKNYFNFVVVVAAVVALGACSVAPRRSVAEVNAAPVDCDKSAEQLAMLDEEMVATHERFASGVASVVPSLAVISIFAGRFKTNVAVATGQYEKALDRKIVEIELQCGLRSIPAA